MNKNNCIYDILKQQNSKKRYLLSTSAGVFNGQVELPCFDDLYQDISAYELIILKNGYLQQGSDRIHLEDTYVFVDNIISISPAMADNGI